MGNCKAVPENQVCQFDRTKQQLRLLSREPAATSSLKCALKFSRFKANGLNPNPKAPALKEFNQALFLTV